jgi:ABC-type Na+ efflux pump permease subunit
MKSGAKTPGLFLMAIGVVAFVICLAGFAHGSVPFGIAAAVVALLATGAGFAWLGMESRRIRHVQQDWSDAHHSAK